MKPGTSQPSLFDLDRETAIQPEVSEKLRAPEAPPTPDQAERRFAVDPENDVVLEASAGTGKTKVLVDRYVRLIEKDVDPSHILAITFTRKAAAEMRERVLAELRKRHAAGAIDSARWRTLLDRVSDIQISTIDAFCFSLLREFPLEAGVEPGFEIADETEMGRFAHEAMELTLRAARSLLPDDEALRLLFARVRLPSLTRAVEELLDRRHIAVPSVASYVKRYGATATPEKAAQAFVDRVRDILRRTHHRAALLDSGPHGWAEFRWLHADLSSIETFSIPADLPRLQQLRRRIERYFLTKSGDPRRRLNSTARPEMFPPGPARKKHEEAMAALAPDFADALVELEASINAVLARGLLRLLQIAATKYERLLDEHALLDFAGMLERAVALLSQQEEFARSRLKLQARHHHVLVDEFQDTSRLQWRLIELLVDAWGEGDGGVGEPTSIFIVGDRKQSIYRFRHAEVTLLDEASRKISALRSGRDVRKVITHSFRAVPELLTFVNALSASITSELQIPERFTYTDRDEFPAPAISPGALRDGKPVLGVIAESSMALCASALAAEVARLLDGALVRVREGEPRPARPDDIAILFRSRIGHQYFEKALEDRGIRTYVYKGLGFFDAPEVQDLQALIRFLAQPDSNLRAAEFLRSRFVRVSDPGLVTLAPAFADALLSTESPASASSLTAGDRAFLDRARGGVARWLAQADRVPPSELVDAVIRESAYVYETRGRRVDQSRENIKKVRSLVRRVESRGYATLGRIAEYFETLRTGEEANAIVEASGCVQLMTMHAAKGLEFPIVFLVNLQMQGRGRGGGFTVVEQGVDGEPEVAFSSTEGTKLEDQRDMEELRRVLYVAATRARDRLYLAAELDQRGLVRRGARSLASLLPASLLNVFAEAGKTEVPEASAGIGSEGEGTGGAPSVTWTTPQGSFTFQVCRAGAAKIEVEQVREDSADLDTSWLTLERAAAVAAGQGPEGPEGPQGPQGPKVQGSKGPRVQRAEGPASDPRLLGTLVHRLFQHGGSESVGDVEHVASRAAGMLRPEERVDVTDVGALAQSAAVAYLRMAERPDVRAALAAGTVMFEVPFSFVPPDSPGDTIRGVIDCLVVRENAAPVLLEFKTGDPRPEHRLQVERYAAAIREILAVKHVETQILYA